METPPQATCDHCGSTVWWIAQENRWNSASNDHSYCWASANHKHHAHLFGARWLDGDR